MPEPVPERKPVAFGVFEWSASGAYHVRDALAVYRTRAGADVARDRDPGTTWVVRKIWTPLPRWPARS